MLFGMLALSLLASGCATSRSDCAWAKLIRPTVEDVSVMSDDLAIQLAAHNEKYKEFCKD